METQYLPSKEIDVIETSGRLFALGQNSTVERCLGKSAPTSNSFETTPDIEETSTDDFEPGRK